MTGNCLTKINSTFPFTEKLKEYAKNPDWQDRYSLWDFVSASSEGIGQVLYEHAKNSVQNIRDIDTCSLHSLYSIANEMDVENVFGYDLLYPPELENIMDLLSTNRSYLLSPEYLLQQNCISDIYNEWGRDVNTITGLISGTTVGSVISGGTSLTNEHGNLLIYKDQDMIENIVIQDDNYITGYLEPIICGHLIQKTRYIPYTEYSPTYTSACVLVPDEFEKPYINPKVEAEIFRVSEEYIGFMDNITSNPEIVWSATTSAAIVTEATHILRNICIKSSYYRDSLKDTAQRHAMIGATRALEKLIYEYIFRSFTKQEDWRYWVAPSGTTVVDSLNQAHNLEQFLPAVSDIENFNVRVIEYWDYTEYMNISAESPLVCGITGYTPVSTVSSTLDLSGNILTSEIWVDTPVWGTGTCGYVVTGGNARFWEEPEKSDFIMLSEHTSAEVESFYKNIGLSGENLDDFCEFQSNLWDTFAVSGLNRDSVFSELSGESLSGIHKKYIGQVSGDTPPANIKNQEYPTMAPQPFLWNLLRKLESMFPSIVDSILFTEQSDTEFLSESVDASGNIIDSWKFFNQEYLGYQTYFEDSPNLDYTENVTPDIDRDGPFNVDVLSAYIIDPSSGNMEQFYDHIGPFFEIEEQMPRIDLQLDYFYSDMLTLSTQLVDQYGFDIYDNHYMLYKDENSFDVTGSIWMRYHNHPLPFPLAGADDKSSIHCGRNREYQQLYTRENLEGIDNIINHCYDFGLVDDVMWVLGAKTEPTSGDMGDSLMIMHNDFITYNDPIGEDKKQFSVVIQAPDYPTPIPLVSGDYRNFVGVYEHNDQIIFVNKVSSTDDSILFKFKHYDKYSNSIIQTFNDDIQIFGTRPIYGLNNPDFKENVFRLSDAEDTISIAYEAENSISGTTDYANSIVTIDLIKNTLSTNPDDYIVREWTDFMEPY